MFSKYGRIYTIDLSATQANGMNWAHVSIFRSREPQILVDSNVSLSTSRTGEVSKASISRLRRAQDKLMEGKHQENQECAVTLQRLERDNQWNSLKQG